MIERPIAWIKLRANSLSFVILDVKCDGFRDTSVDLNRRTQIMTTKPETEYVVRSTFHPVSQTDFLSLFLCNSTTISNRGNNDY